MLSGLAFCSLEVAARALENWRPDCIVSAFSPRRPIAALEDRPHLRLAFHDVEGPIRGRSPVNAGQIAVFLRFVEAQRQGRLLVHCRAGISRAPALAIVAALSTGMSLPRILERLSPLAAMLRPNRLVLAFGAAQLGIGGVLLQQVVTVLAAGYGRPPRAPLPSLVGLLPDDNAPSAPRRA